MRRVYAGSTVSETFTVATGGTFASTVWDALGQRVSSSVTESGGTATLTIAADNWRNQASGFGRIEITRTSGGVKSVEVAERFRILPGLSVEPATDYA